MSNFASAFTPISISTAKDKISSFLSIGVIFVTTKFPLVKVPVLSKTKIFA